MFSGPKNEMSMQMKSQKDPYFCVVDAGKCLSFFVMRVGFVTDLDKTKVI